MKRFGDLRERGIVGVPDDDSFMDRHNRIEAAQRALGISWMDPKASIISKHISGELVTDESTALFNHAQELIRATECRAIVADKLDICDRNTLDPMDDLLVDLNFETHESEYYCEDSEDYNSLVSEMTPMPCSKAVDNSPVVMTSDFPCIISSSTPKIALQTPVMRQIPPLSQPTYPALSPPRTPRIKSSSSSPPPSPMDLCPTPIGSNRVVRIVSPVSSSPPSARPVIRSKNNTSYKKANDFTPQVMIASKYDETPGVKHAASNSNFATPVLRLPVVNDEFATPMETRGPPAAAVRMAAYPVRTPAEEVRSEEQSACTPQPAQRQPNRSFCRRLQMSQAKSSSGPLMRRHASRLHHLARRPVSRGVAPDHLLMSDRVADHGSAAQQSWDSYLQSMSATPGPVNVNTGALNTGETANFAIIRVRAISGLDDDDGPVVYTQDEDEAEIARFAERVSAQIQPPRLELHDSDLASSVCSTDIPSLRGGVGASPSVASSLGRSVFSAWGRASSVISAVTSRVSRAVRTPAPVSTSANPHLLAPPVKRSFKTPMRTPRMQYHTNADGAGAEGENVAAYPAPPQTRSKFDWKPSDLLAAMSPETSSVSQTPRVGRFDHRDYGSIQRHNHRMSLFAPLTPAAHHNATPLLLRAPVNENRVGNSGEFCKVNNKSSMSRGFDQEAALVYETPAINRRPGARLTESARNTNA